MTGKGSDIELEAINPTLPSVCFDTKARVRAAKFGRKVPAVKKPADEY